MRCMRSTIWTFSRADCIHSALVRQVLTAPNRVPIWSEIRQIRRVLSLMFEGGRGCCWATAGSEPAAASNMAMRNACLVTTPSR